MGTNSNVLRDVLKVGNPYSKTGYNRLSRRRSILFEEMCSKFKPFSSMKQLRAEIKLEDLAIAHVDFYQHCPIKFELDLVCAAKNFLQLLKKLQSIERSYDPEFNKPIYKPTHAKKLIQCEVITLPIGVSIERKAA
jgi:hypothetical protein